MIVATIYLVVRAQILLIWLTYYYKNEVHWRTLYNFLKNINPNPN